MPVKKSAAAKKRTSSRKTTPAKRGPGRPKGSKNKTTAKKATAPAKRGPGRPKGSTNKKSVKDVKKPVSKRGGFHREINDETGFVAGTDQDTIALALLAGGESRGAIVDDLYETMETETRNGTDKQITNMVSGVLNKMLAAGFTVESSFSVVPPTAASKRAATRAANAAAKPARKTAAKKTATKRGPGRPKGSKNRK